VLGKAIKDAREGDQELSEQLVALGRGRDFAHSGGRSADLDRLPRRHHGQPVAEVFQLPHVAGEVEPAGT
jgi:hypothetical protein